MAQSNNGWGFLNEFVEEVKQKTTKDLNKGLDKATNYLAQQLINNTPKRRGITRDSWIETLQYTNVKFINNTALNKNNIPIINLLEFGSKGNPFVRRTFENSKSEMEQIVENELNKENK